MAIRLLITDFDGTLVNTFTANFRAYQKAMQEYGIYLSEEKYKECFGFRFDRFMDAVGIHNEEIRKGIKEKKAKYYLEFFEYLEINNPLMDFLKVFHAGGGKTAIASTARRVNLMNVLNHFGETDSFDLILGGEEVSKGKPDPEIYQKVIYHFGVSPEEALVFEDSPVGMEAASRAGLSYLPVTPSFFRPES